MSDFIKCYTCIKSWDNYCTVTLCEAVTVYCIVKTTLSSDTFLKPNCIYILMIMSYKT